MTHIKVLLITLSQIFVVNLSFSQSPRYSFEAIDGSPIAVPKIHWTNYISIGMLDKSNSGVRESNRRVLFNRFETTAWQMMINSNYNLLNQQSIDGDFLNITFGVLILDSNIYEDESFSRMSYPENWTSIISSSADRGHTKIENSNHNSNCSAIVDHKYDDATDFNKLNSTLIIINDSLSLVDMEDCFNDLLYRIFELDFVIYNFQGHEVLPPEQLGHPFFLMISFRCRSIFPSTFELCWREELSQTGRRGLSFFSSEI